MGFLSNLFDTDTSPPLGPSLYGKSVKKIVGAWEDAQAKANKANEQRYQDILDTLRRGYRGSARAAIRDVKLGGQEERADILHSAVSRGLGNTTVLDALNNRSRERVAREVSRIRQSTKPALAQQLAGVMERRTDAGPDLGMYAQLMQLLGQGNPLGGWPNSPGPIAGAFQGALGAGIGNMFGGLFGGIPNFYQGQQWGQG